MTIKSLFGLNRRTSTASGFFGAFVEHGDFCRLVENLPEHLQPVVEFLYYGGWRKSAARNLEWKEIDLRARMARLKAEDSKNGESWTLPLAGRLWEIVETRLKARRLDCPYVFHDDGQKIGDFREAWQSACVAAGLGKFIEEPKEQDKKERQRKKYSGLIIHDLRRCAAPQSVSCRRVGSGRHENHAAQDGQHVPALSDYRRERASRRTAENAAAPQSTV